MRGGHPVNHFRHSEASRTGALTVVDLDIDVDGLARCDLISPVVLNLLELRQVNVSGLRYQVVQFGRSTKAVAEQMACMVSRLFVRGLRVVRNATGFIQLERFCLCRVNPTFAIGGVAVLDTAALLTCRVRNVGLQHPVRIEGIIDVLEFGGDLLENASRKLARTLFSHDSRL